MTLAEIGLPSAVLLWHAVLLAIISFLVGILGGFVGLALGTMRLPAMLLLGMPAPVAGGTNIMVSSLASLAGTIRHLRAGRVNLRIVLTMGVPAFLGAFIGGLFSDRTPEHLLIALAGALVFWQGVEFLPHRPRPHPLRAGWRRPFRRRPGGFPRPVHPRTDGRRGRHRFRRRYAGRRRGPHPRQHPPARTGSHPPR